MEVSRNETFTYKRKNTLYKHTGGNDNHNDSGDSAALYFFGQQEYSGCRRHPYAVCNAVEFPADYPVSNASDRVCDSIMRCDRPYDVR